MTTISSCVTWHYGTAVVTQAANKPKPVTHEERGCLVVTVSMPMGLGHEAVYAACVTCDAWIGTAGWAGKPSGNRGERPVPILIGNTAYSSYEEYRAKADPDTRHVETIKNTLMRRP